MGRFWFEWGGEVILYCYTRCFAKNTVVLIIVCVAIYAVLVQNIALDADIGKAIWTCMGYTVLLCFTLFKTSSMARSIFAAH